jgi:hypothetical protein
MVGRGRPGPGCRTLDLKETMAIYSEKLSEVDRRFAELRRFL